ncbi:MAG TPA: hypothetical protein VIY52_29045, partial [Streptosporangiaceae bacterium]
CNANPKCRHDHRLKQDPRWTAEQLPGGQVRWTTPSGRQYTTEPPATPFSQTRKRRTPLRPRLPRAGLP